MTWVEAIEGLEKRIMQIEATVRHLVGADGTREASYVLFKEYQAFRSLIEARLDALEGEEAEPPEEIAHESPWVDEFAVRLALGQERKLNGELRAALKRAEQERDEWQRRAEWLGHSKSPFHRTPSVRSAEE